MTRPPSGTSKTTPCGAGVQSVAVLQRYYAKVLDCEEAKMNALIEQGLTEHEAEDEGP
ncbi:hypothetical protein [Streptomyces europaeiscabiei]|uniref:hypothetical protein n=1 Tax=Streptomyces europaeiscabiei TaxID=146819 RepID=UPI002E2A8B69|nr:hypothetical protein [Streptomyces europaeiscabiei]